MPAAAAQLTGRTMASCYNCCAFRVHSAFRVCFYLQTLFLCCLCTDFVETLPHDVGKRKRRAPNFVRCPLGRDGTPRARYRWATWLYSLQPHCYYVDRANFSQASRGFVSDSWAFLFSLWFTLVVLAVFTQATLKNLM